MATAFSHFFNSSSSLLLWLGKHNTSQLSLL